MLGIDQDQYEITEEEQISRAYLEYLSKDPASTALLAGDRICDTVYDLSVIIPCYNVESYVEKCVASVLAQRQPRRIEILLIDDGSTDRTGELLAQYEGQEDVTVIHQENRGLSCARNTALDAARGRYLFFLDSDDYLAADSLQELLDAAYRHDADIVEAGMRYILPDQQEAEGVITQGSSECVEVNAFSLSGYACGKVFKRELFDAVRFPERYWFEDAMITWLVLPRARRVFRYSGEVYCYRQNMSGISAAALTGDVKVVDTWWITEQMHHDFVTMGLDMTQAMYEAVLDQIVLNRVRAAALTQEARVAIFHLMTGWFVRSFAGFETAVPRLSIVERSLRLKDFNLYEKACAAAWRAKGAS